MSDYAYQWTKPGFHPGSITVCGIIELCADGRLLLRPECASNCVGYVSAGDARMLARSVLGPDDEADEIVRAARWTPCTELMPGDNEYALVVYDGGQISIARWSGEEWFEEISASVDGEVSFRSVVSHWAPLPNVPGEDCLDCVVVDGCSTAHRLRAERNTAVSALEAEREKVARGEWLADSLENSLDVEREAHALTRGLHRGTSDDLELTRATIDRLKSELAAVDRALGIPPGREPRRLSLLIELRSVCTEGHRLPGILSERDAALERVRVLEGELGKGHMLRTGEGLYGSALPAAPSGQPMTWDCACGYRSEPEAPRAVVVGEPYFTLECGVPPKVLYEREDGGWTTNPANARRFATRMAAAASRDSRRGRHDLDIGEHIDHEPRKPEPTSSPGEDNRCDACGHDLESHGGNGCLKFACYCQRVPLNVESPKPAAEPSPGGERTYQSLSDARAVIDRIRFELGVKDGESTILTIRALKNAAQTTGRADATNEPLCVLSGSRGNEEVAASSVAPAVPDDGAPSGPGDEPELPSPPFTPPELVDFAARGYVRENRHRGEPEAPRAVVVGSVWRNKLYGHKRTVLRVSAESVTWIDAGGYRDTWRPVQHFVDCHEHLKDPEPTSGEGRES